VGIAKAHHGNRRDAPEPARVVPYESNQTVLRRGYIRFASVERLDLDVGQAFATELLFQEPQNCGGAQTGGEEEVDVELSELRDEIDGTAALNPADVDGDKPGKRSRSQSPVPFRLTMLRAEQCRDLRVRIDRLPLHDASYHQGLEDL